ncbi:MAG: hypothetical protein OXG52_08485, partial [bacterium]|nr:hypothetical protein [bacterium]
MSVAAALFAGACGGAESEPSLTSERPEPVPPASVLAPAAEPAPQPPPGTTTTTAVPVRLTTEPTIVVGASPEADALGAEEPELPDVPLPEEMTNPGLTELPSDQLPPPPPPLPPPPAAPAWAPATILVSKDDFNGIVPVYDSPNGSRLAFPDGDVWSYTYRRNRLVARVLQGSPGDEWGFQPRKRTLLAPFGIGTI